MLHCCHARLQVVELLTANIVHGYRVCIRLMRFTLVPLFCRWRHSVLEKCVTSALLQLIQGSDSTRTTHAAYTATPNQPTKAAVPMCSCLHVDLICLLSCRYLSSGTTPPFSESQKPLCNLAAYSHIISKSETHWQCTLY